MMSNTALAVVRACMQAYVDKDRAAIEALLDEDYHFTSPIDNAVDRATYLKVCWPNSSAMARFDRIYEMEDGNRGFIVYEAHTSTGKCFRNCEVHTVRDGKLVATEVYFGRDVPHAPRARTRRMKAKAMLDPVRRSRPSARSKRRSKKSSRAAEKFACRKWRSRKWAGWPMGKIRREIFLD